MTEAQLVALAEPEVDRALFDDRTLAALDYADAITTSTADNGVDEQVFGAVQQHFDTEGVVVLTELIAWENASARFNRALGVESQELWKHSSDDTGE